MLYLLQNRLGLDCTIRRIQSNHLLVTHHFHRNFQTHNLHRVLHDQPGHQPDRQHPEDQPARLAGHVHIITVVSGLPDQSSSTPVAHRTGWLAHLYKATGWFTCWMCGSKADWYEEGETGQVKVKSSQKFIEPWPQ